MSDELPKEALLLKLLNMTTSDNDNIALMSARKANDLLASAGWSWEKLLQGKIKVVADPFGPRIAPEDDPLERMASRSTGAPRPPMPRKQPPPPSPSQRPAGNSPIYSKPYTRGATSGPFNRPPSPNPPQSAPAAFTARSALGMKTQISNRVNNYANHCYLCGDAVNSQEGFIFRAIDINPTAKNGWENLCAPCNKLVDHVIPSKRAQKWANVNQPTTANL